MELALPADSSIPADCDRLPLAPIERFLLRNDQPAHPMVFRVLLRFDGPVQKDCFTKAFQLAISRQPLLTSIVQGTGLQAIWQRSGQLPQLLWQPAGWTAEEIVHVPVESMSLTEGAGIRCRIWPVAGESESGMMILLEVHHACSDGQGARQLLAEWFGLYQQLIQNEALQLPALAYGQLKNRAHYRTPTPPIGTWEGLRNLYLTIRGRTARLPEQFPQSPLPDFLCEHVYSAEGTACLRLNLKRLGLSINDVGLATAFSTFQQCFPHVTRKGYITVMHPVDLRWPSDLRTPACNRVGISFLRLKQRECLEQSQLLSHVRGEMQYIKRRYVGAEFLRGLAAAEKLPGGIDRVQNWGWFVPSLQFTCLGDTTRALHYRFNQVEGVINFGGLKLHRISGFMQLGPFLPISLAACETNQKLTLTARISSRHLTHEEAQKFFSVYVDQFSTTGGIR